MPEIEHPTEELLAALFETPLPAADVEHLLAHLDACQVCGQRVELLEPGFARYRRCRELISTRLPKPPQPWRDVALELHQDRPARRAVPTAAKRAAPRPVWIGTLAAGILMGAILFWPSSASELRAETLLRKARSSTPHRSPRAQVRVITPAGAFLRPAVLQAAADPQGTEAIEARFNAAGYPWSDPLNAVAYAAWREHRAHRTVEVREYADQYTIRTATEIGAIKEASLTLNATDFSPVSERFVFSPNDWVEITRAPDATAELTVPFAPPTSKPPEPPPEPAAEKSVAERELLTRLAIDRLDTGPGEPIDVKVEPDGRIVVTPYWLGERRENQLRISLQGIERVTVRSPDEPQRQQEPPAALAGADAAIDTSNAISSRAHLLNQLAQRFPPETESELSAPSRQELRALRRRHAHALESDIETLKQALVEKQSMRLPAAGPALTDAASKALLESAVAVNRMITSLYSEKVAGGAPALQRLGEEVSRLQSLARQYSQEVQQ